MAVLGVLRSKGSSDLRLWATKDWMESLARFDCIGLPLKRPYTTHESCNYVDPYIDLPKRTNRKMGWQLKCNHHTGRKFARIRILEAWILCAFGVPANENLIIDWVGNFLFHFLELTMM